MLRAIENGHHEAAAQPLRAAAKTIETQLLEKGAKVIILPHPSPSFIIPHHGPSSFLIILVGSTGSIGSIPLALPCPISPYLTSPYPKVTPTVEFGWWSAEESADEQRLGAFRKGGGGLLYPPPVGGYRLGRSAVSPKARGAAPRNYKPLATLAAEVAGVPAALRSIAIGLDAGTEPGAAVSGSTVARAAKYRALLEGAWGRAASGMELQGIGDATLASAKAIENALAALDRTGTADSPVGELVTVIRDSRDLVTQLRLVPKISDNAELLGHHLDYWWLARTLLVSSPLVTCHALF